MTNQTEDKWLQLDIFIRDAASPSYLNSFSSAGVNRTQKSGLRWGRIRFPRRLARGFRRLCRELRPEFTVIKVQMLESGRLMSRND